jgi:hypothetical protein
MTYKWFEKRLFHRTDQYGRYTHQIYQDGFVCIIKIKTNFRVKCWDIDEQQELLL